MKIKNVWCLFLIIITIFPEIYASTIYKNKIKKNKVSPFSVCLTNGPTSIDFWPTTFVKSKQHVPFCMTEKLSIDDYKNLTIFEKDVFASVALWQSYFKIHNKSINVEITVNNALSRFSGMYQDGLTKIKYIKSSGLKRRVIVTEPRAKNTMLNEIKNTTIKKRDIIVTIKPGYSLSDYCLDNTPTKSNLESDCSEHWDLPSVLMHELGHGYGIASLRTNYSSPEGYGNFFQDINGYHLSSFDFQTNRINNDLLKPYASYFSPGHNAILFTGKMTMHYLKQQRYTNKKISRKLKHALPLTNRPLGSFDESQNFSHLSNIDRSIPVPEAKSNIVTDDLMGLWAFWKNDTRLDISSLDLKILADIGYAKAMRNNGNELVSPMQRTNIFNN